MQKSIKVKDFLEMDKLQEYFRQLESEQEKRQKILKLTQLLLEKSQSKLKRVRVENRFNEKLKDMKQLNTFMDVKQNIIDLNVVNNNKQLHINLSNTIPQDQNFVFHYNKGKLQQIPCHIDPKLYDITRDPPRSQELTFSDASKYVKKFKLSTNIEETFITQSQNQNATQSKITKSDNLENSEKTALLFDTNQKKLSYSQYYQKYKQQTNTLIKNMKLKCKSAYDESNSQQSTMHSKIFKKLGLSQKYSIQTSPPIKNLISKQIKHKDQEPPGSCEIKINRNADIMIQNYQNNAFQGSKRFKTPQYRRNIGKKFLSFNKSLTDIETEMSRSSQDNVSIIKKMDDIVSKVYDRYKTQTNSFNFD